jgi:hypothetical protein
MAGLFGRTGIVYRIAALLALVAGCEPVTFVPSAEPNPPDANRTYGTTAGPAGRVSGQVIWAGEVPAVLPFQAVKGMGGTRETHFVPNPFAPIVDRDSHGLTGAVVYLRGVDPTRAKAWDRSPITVEVTEDEIRMNGGRVGLVPVGGEVSFVSRNPTPQVIRGRGDDFFSFALPDPGVPRVRRFDRPGRVELTSGAGQFWMRADLFVCEHPYYAVTDPSGRFMFEDVPPGRYELVAWHGNWMEGRHERDPDSGLVARLYFAEPVEVVQTVVLEPGGQVDTSITMDGKAFHPATK